jgi:imidazolonepropionase-like amidohydrolase
MKFTSLLTLLYICANGLAAQQPDSGTFLLHKFAQHIGREHYKVVKDGQGTTYDIDFKFVDRGSPVQLHAMLQTGQKGEAVRFDVKGKNCRFCVINDSVGIRNNEAYIKAGDSVFQKNGSDAFTISGYAPGTVQMAMLQYWREHHRPEKLNILPAGSVQIKMSGFDTLSFNNKPLVLEKYIVGGLIWGNEFIWTDRQGQLYCIITNDAEADKLEMMLEPYESLLPELIKRAASYSMQLFASQQQPAKPKTIAFTGGTLIDVINKKEIPHATIFIENGMIKSINTSENVSIPADTYTVHAEGKYILPGLWDMHAHFEQAEWGPAYLAAGVTTVRDCGNEFEFINSVKTAIDHGKGVGPHILKAGIIDGKGPRAIGVIQADTKDEAVKAVDRYKENGFVQIKIYSSVKPATVKAICEEAHRLGLTVTGHIPEGMNIMQGVDSGMDMVNHIAYVSMAEKTDRKNGTVDFSDPTNKKLIEFLKEHHTVIDPTLGVYEMVSRPLSDPITAIEPAFATLPLPLQQIFVNMGSSPEQARMMKPYMSINKQTVKALYDNGITIVAGTDQVFPGFSVWRELELYVESGLPAGDALQTATIIPARIMKLDNQYGSIAEGKNADLVIDDADPLQNISNLRKISLVIKDGNIYDPIKMHEMAGFSK